jgi:hypothetical protein
MDIGKIEQLTNKTIATSDVPINLQFVTQKRYKWYPCQDITTYELALCIPVLLEIHMWDYEKFIKQLPDNARRHFEEIKDDKND